MKKVLSALLVVLMLIPVSFAYAETATPVKEKLQEFKAKKEVMKQNKTENEALRKSAKEKTVQMKTKIKEMRKNKETFPLEKLDQIETQLKLVKQDSAALKSLDSVMVNFERFRTYRKNKDTSAALSALDKIISIQKQRNGALTKLNGDLDSLLSLVNA